MDGWVLVQMLPQVAAVNRVVDTNALTDIVPNYAEAWHGMDVGCLFC